MGVLWVLQHPGSQFLKSTVGQLCCNRYKVSRSLQDPCIALNTAVTFWNLS